VKKPCLEEENQARGLSKIAAVGGEVVKRNSRRQSAGKAGVQRSPRPREEKKWPTDLLPSPTPKHVVNRV